MIQHTAFTYLWIDYTYKVFTYLMWGAKTLPSTIPVPVPTKPLIDMYLRKLIILEMGGALVLSAPPGLALVTVRPKLSVLVTIRLTNVSTLWHLATLCLVRGICILENFEVELLSYKRFARLQRLRMWRLDILLPILYIQYTRFLVQPCIDGQVATQTSCFVFFIGCDNWRCQVVRSVSTRQWTRRGWCTYGGNANSPGSSWPPRTTIQWSLGSAENHLIYWHGPFNLVISHFLWF